VHSAIPGRPHESVTLKGDPLTFCATSERGRQYPMRNLPAEDRESVRSVVERLRREYLEMTRKFERVC
jgi:hypothetical protein